MAVYSPNSVGISAPAGGFQQGGWYGGRQYWGGTLSEPGQIHPSSNQQGAGQLVSQEVNAQSARQQGTSSQQFESYLQQQRQTQQVQQPTPAPAPQPQRNIVDNAGVGYQGLISTQPTIDLPALYQSLSQSSGITNIQSNISNLERQYLESRNKISDNPFLDASTIDKRLQRLQGEYEKEVQPLKNEIAMKQADIEMQLNLQTKQFDINSQQAKQALDQFNTLLSIGALDNANGDDIAAIVRTTGLSSSMVQSAINASVQSKQKEPNTQTIQYDDGTNQGFAIINSDTGEIINQQVIAGSKPTKTSSSGGGLTATQSRNVTSIARQALIDVDLNSDKALSLPEYQQAVEQIMIDAGVDFATADNYATTAFNDLGYVTWKWSNY